MKIINFLFPSLVPMLLFAQNIQKGKNYYVMTESGTLNLRKSPEKGQVIQKIKRGTLVKITKTNNEDSSLPYGWVEVSVGKNKGFVSTQFLSTISPNDLEKAHIIGSLKATDKAGVNHLQPIALDANQTWLGVSIDQVESSAFLKLALDKKYNLSILDKTGKRIANGNIFEVGQFGCQSYKGGKIRSKLDTSNNSYFVTYGFEPQSIELNEKINDGLAKEIRQLAVKEFLKNNIPQEETQDLIEKHFLIKANGNQFLLSRLATKKGDFEHGNLFLAYILNGNELGKQIFNNFSELSEEVAPYGGGYHVLGGFVKEGKIIIIIHSNGFDGYLQEIYELSPKEMKLLASGGGDAC